jgi:hypothetical protein
MEAKQLPAVAFELVGFAELTDALGGHAVVHVLTGLGELPKGLSTGAVVAGGHRKP